MKKTNEKFIEEAKKLHSNKYTYEKANYQGNKKKVIITCPVHGDFEQIPNSHLLGFGCKKCSNTYSPSKEEFIQKCFKIHCNKYDYSKVLYKNDRTKILIICPKHGEFEQKAGVHLSGCGCPACGYEKNGNIKRKSKDQFILESKKIYGDKYDYSKVVYKNTETHVIITCPIHGDFEQIPKSHLKGFGCYACSESKGERAIRNYLNKLNLKFEPQYKFKKSEIKRSSFDFLVSNFLIEYHGKQHYWPYSFTKVKNEKIDNKIFTENINRDVKKMIYCQKNNIPLLIIPYWEMKNIPEIIDEYLKTKLLKFNKSIPEPVMNYEKIRQKIMNKLGFPGFKRHKNIT